MSPHWMMLAAAIAARPAGAAMAVAAAISVASGIVIWRRARQRREMMTAVAEWQRESLHARTAELSGPDEVAGAGGAEGLGRPARVLVVDERTGQRERMAGVLERMGMAPAFADSRWAASVAARHAESEGTPYDLILINKAMETATAEEVQPPEWAESPASACV
jgi:hypothetical protein